jgi:hypothetical protein
MFVNVTVIVTAEPAGTTPIDATYCLEPAATAGAAINTALVIANSGTMITNLRNRLCPFDIEKPPWVPLIGPRPAGWAGPKEHRIRNNGGQWDRCGISVTGGCSTWFAAKIGPPGKKETVNSYPDHRLLQGCG